MDVSFLTMIRLPYVSPEVFAKLRTADEVSMNLLSFRERRRSDVPWRRGSAPHLAGVVLHKNCNSPDIFISSETW